MSSADDSTATGETLIAVPPPRTPRRTHSRTVTVDGSPLQVTASSNSVPLPAMSSSAPRVQPLIFTPPPPTFQMPGGPALRYSVATALASPAVYRVADTEATVFAPLQGSGTTGRMFDAASLVENYSSPGPSASPPPSAATTAAAPASNIRAPLPIPAVAPAAGGRSLSTLFSTLGGALFGTGTATSESSGITVSRTITPSHAAGQEVLSTTHTTQTFSFTSRSPAPPDNADDTSAPSSSASTPSHASHSLAVPAASLRALFTPSPPPPSATSSSVALSPSEMQAAIRGPPLVSGSSSASSSSESLSSGVFSASGPCILCIPCGFIPLPVGLPQSQIDAMWDPERTKRGKGWIKQLNPYSLRRRFAPGLYLKLLGAQPPPTEDEEGGMVQQQQAPQPAEAAKAGSKPAVPVAPVPSPVDLAIRKDLARTFPSHALFHTRYGLSVLFNALKAFATFDPAVGYSQGMAFIAGMMMIHYGNPEETQAEAYAAATVAQSCNGISVEQQQTQRQQQLEAASASSASAGSPFPVDPAASPPPLFPCAAVPLFSSFLGESEEILFFSLVQVMQGRKHNLRSLYSDDCVGLRLILQVLSEALEELEPVLASHLREQGAEVAIYATGWIVAVFSHRFRPGFASATFEHFMNVGLPFLVANAVMILKHLRSALLLKPFDQLVPFLGNVALAELPDDLPDRAFVEVQLPARLVNKLQPNETRSTSFKTRRG